MGVIANLGHVHVSNWLPRTSIETQFACLAAQERGHWRKSSAKVVCSCLLYRWKLRQCPPVPTSAMALFSSALTIAHPRAQRPSSSPAWPQRCPSARNARGKSAAGPRSLRLHRGSILTWPNHSLEPIRFPSSCGLQKCMPRGHEGLCPWWAKHLEGKVSYTLAPHLALLPVYGSSPKSTPWLPSPSPGLASHLRVAVPRDATGSRPHIPNHQYHKCKLPRSCADKFPSGFHIWDPPRKRRQRVSLVQRSCRQCCCSLPQSSARACWTSPGRVQPMDQDKRKPSQPAQLYHQRPHLCRGNWEVMGSTDTGGTEFR